MFSMSLKMRLLRLTLSEAICHPIGKGLQIFSTAAVCVLFIGGAAAAESRSSSAQREVIPLEKWQFWEEPGNAGPLREPPKDAKWTTVSVPHVFRQSGVADDSAGWYRTGLNMSGGDADRQFWLILEGAASVKDVYVNGRFIGQHKGAFSKASFDLTPALREGSNVVDVRVGNRDEEAKGCLSRSFLYYVNGGMFRKASMLKTGAVYIAPDRGSTGLYLTPVNIKTSSAEMEMEASVRNASGVAVDARVDFSIKDPSGLECGKVFDSRSIQPGDVVSFNAKQKLEAPKRWDLGSPNLYSVTATVSVSGRPTDMLTEKTGIRTIRWKEGRFYLNDREVQFRGVCKHAQDEYSWNAISDEELRGEWDDMTEMGLNAVRLAHYPHSALEYEIADERGIAVWAENGFAGQSWGKSAPSERVATPDGDRLTIEMVRQNWNHPSILFWSAGNEAIINVVSHYASLIRKEDSTRLTSYAANNGANEPHPINCDFVAENTYDGWYSGAYTDFGDMPRNAVISETGAGNWATHHVPYGAADWVVDKFEPEEYAGMFTEYRLQTIFKNDVQRRPMFFWWAYRDFYNLKFKNNRNTKGLRTLAGARKDTWYLFQAFMNAKTPVVHLVGRQHFLRSFAADNGIKAYSNSRELELIVNGESKGFLINGAYRIPDSQFKEKDGSVRVIGGITVDNVFFWKVALAPGKNTIQVKDRAGNSDSIVIYQSGSSPGGGGDSAVVQNLQSSNPANAATFIDRPVEAQGAFYACVDGSSDNTFDQIPEELSGSRWIATKRLSAPENKTDLSFSISEKAAPGVDVFVLFSTGSYPVVTLKGDEPNVTKAAEAMRKQLSESGFRQVPCNCIWRDHDAKRTFGELWKLTAKPGSQISIPGLTLDYVVLVKTR